MASVESRAVMKHEEEEELDAVEKGETVPSAAPSLLTTTSPTLYFILKPGQAIQGGKEQGIIVANQENNLVSASAPSVDPEGPSREAIPLPGVLSADSICKGVKVTLQNNHVWNEFHCFKTEMILTKQGRRMFPYCSFSISGLEPLKRYILVMDIAPVDNIRWKWNGHEWEAGGRAEPHVLGRVFIHPESPSLGQYWTQNTVSFYKLKLTNNTQDQEGYMILHSMHRYLPRLHLVPAELATDVIQLNGPDVMTFTFPQTEFFAVTAYQNMRITQLKIYYNPFAKGFREEGQCSQISKPTLDPSEPLFCPPPELNGSNNKLRHLHKTLQSLIGPRGDIEGMESQHSQTAGHGAVLINGMQDESEIRGEKHPCPMSGKESKLKMRKCNAKAQDSAHVEEELGIASEEPQLDNQSSVAGEPRWSKQGGGNLMLVKPSSEQSTTLHVHAPVSSECNDSHKTPILNTNSQEEISSTIKAKPNPNASRSPFTIPTSLCPSQKPLSPSHKPSPPSCKSLSLFGQSSAGIEKLCLRKPSPALSGKEVGPHHQLTPSKQTRQQVATPPHRPSGITQLSPASSGKRKRKPKAKHSGKRRKLMSKAGLDAMKVAERPVEAALLPDLEDVEGLLFVSFVSKDAMDVHLKDPLHHKQSLPPQETTESPEINEIVETLEDRIVRLQDVLVLDLQRFKHRQVIHPVLQEVGLKLSLLDPALVIDLGYLGVRLPLPPPVLSPVGKGGTAGHIPSADGAHFVSRTGKTKDFTKIKGWREKFVSTEASSLKCADAGTDADRDTDLSAEAGLRNRSAFCSDMLDAYLEKESRQMDVSATLAFSSATAPPNSTPIVLYQLPTKSSSYVRPLQSVLNKQAPKLTLSTPHPHPLKPPGELTKSKSKSKPKSKPVQVPRPTLSTVKHPTSVSAKPAAKIQAATKKELAPWLSIPAPRTPPGSAKPEVRLSRVQLKLMHMEMGAVWKGKSPTHITKERAELALAALVTAQGTLKGRSFNTKPTPHLCPPCGQVFCRLGCVCASLARERQVPTHCRKPACIFGCSCLKRKVVLIKPSPKKQPKPAKDDVIALEIPVEEILSKSQPDQGDIITKEASVEEALSKCKSGQGNLIAKESSLEGKPDQGDVISEETSAEEVSSQSRSNQGGVIAKETPVEEVSSKPRADQSDIIPKETLVESSSKSTTDQDEVIAKETLVEEVPTKSKTDQDEVIAKETLADNAKVTLGEEFLSKCHSDQSDLIVQENTKKNKKKKKKKKKKRKKERMSYTMSEPEVELEMEPAVHMYRLWNRQKEEVDPEPLYIPKPQLTPIRPYVPRPNPVVREEDKDPVYRYFESMMTCARVREYANKPLAERPLCSCTSVLCSGKICDHYYNPNLEPKEKKDGKMKAKPKPHLAREEPRQVLEIMSEFDWEPERDRVLTVLCQRMASRELSQPFHIGPYHIQPSEPFLRMDGQVCCTVIKVCITRPPGLTSEETPAKSFPPGHPKAVDRDGAKNSLPAWPCTVHPGLLTARKKQPGVPAKGLIKVNGKSYSQAKLQLGQMGALHPSSRLAAYIAGRLKPTSRNGSVLASLIFKSDGYAQSKGNVTPCVTTATTSITTATAGISGQVPAASSIVKPLELSVQQTAPKDKPPSTHLLLVPVQAPGHTSATPPPAGTLLPLTPGQSVVLQPVHSASGARLFCQPNGQLVHLLPFNQLRNVPPHLRTKSPGAVGPLSQPQPLAPVCDSSSGLQNKSPTTAMLGPSLPPALTESPVCITTTAPLSHSAHQSETADSHSTPATKPVPSFLGHSGTYRFRIGPSTASRVEHSASPPVTPTCFTPLHVPLVLTSESSQKEKALIEGPTPLLSPDPGSRDLAETESRDSSDTYDSNGEQQSHEASSAPAATPVVTSHRASKAACAVRTLAQSNSGVEGESPLSEDSEEDSEDETNDADTVDVETVEELSGKVGITPMKAGTVEKNLKEVGLIHQANRQAELEARLLLSQDEVDTARQSHNMSEHQRRCKLRDKFLSLQQVLGLQPSAKLSRFHILRQACAEIQALVDQCNHLEEKKRRMTQMRGIYIRKISQSSGKTEELIRQKLQEICAKQKSLEAQRKKGGSRVGVQPALEPNRSKSPLTPVSAETKVCLLPKIVDVRSLVTSPLKTTGTAELEKQSISEAAKTTDKSFAQAKDCGTVSQEGLPVPFQNEIFLVAQPPMPGSQEKGGASSQEEEEEGGGQADPDDAAH
ncbi:hypothetical protein JZ751_004876 [Albula glossodonta]|uniref:MAX gene-associated protein-like n=1 Tax=Albula glossodonta TaxID=121402 RepID=A0A8T2P4U0_9TELE|nr:hypothetical protein JZ751_004876 [Albula glossodonta]